MGRTLCTASLLLVVALMATTASADTWSLIGTIGVGASDPLSIDNDGTNLLVLSNNFGGDRVHVYTTGGTLLHDYPCGTNFTYGIAGTSPGHAAINKGTGANTMNLYSMDLSNGALTGPFGFAGWGGSMTFDGGSTLYMVDGGTSNVIRTFDSTTLLPTGTISASPPFNLSIVSGITWLSGHLHILASFADPTIYVVDGAINVLSSIGVASSLSPQDVTAMGGDLFVLNRGNLTIYRYTRTDATPTASTSWGKVKSLYQ